jgi:oxygen-dependent protoporphyrinogen oxidase
LAGQLPLSIPLESRRQPTRHYAVNNKDHPPKSIAILGGGLTGLSTAWYLTRLLPEAKITIYEAQKRMGGWIQTDKVEVKTPDGEVGTVHFERAARMVTPQTTATRIPKWDDLVFFDLVCSFLCRSPWVELNVADCRPPSPRSRSSASPTSSCT